MSTTKSAFHEIMVNDWMHLQNCISIDLHIDVELPSEFHHKILCQLSISYFDIHVYFWINLFICLINFAQENKRLNQNIKNFLIVDEIRTNYDIDFLLPQLLLKLLMVRLVTPAEF